MDEAKSSKYFSLVERYIKIICMVMNLLNSKGRSYMKRSLLCSVLDDSNRGTYLQRRGMKNNSTYIRTSLSYMKALMRDIYIWLDDTHGVTQKERKLWAFDKSNIPQLDFKLNDIMCIIRWYISAPLMSFFTIEGMFQHVYLIFSYITFAGTYTHLKPITHNTINSS